MTKSILKTASSENASDNFRITIPVQTATWDQCPVTDADREVLLWAQQHIADQALTWAAVKRETGFDRSTIFRVLSGTYGASDWGKPVAALSDWRARVAASVPAILDAPEDGADGVSMIPSGDTCALYHNDVVRRVWTACDYAQKKSELVLVTGESRMGKTASAKAWREKTGAAASIFVEVPPVGGVRSVVEEFARALGIGKTKRKTVAEMVHSVAKGLSPRRVVILDEVARLLPSENSGTATRLETVRSILDKSGCGMVLLATQRFTGRISEGAAKYQYEQFMGRIIAPFELREFTRQDVAPIIACYIPDLSAAIVARLVELAKRPGRLGVLKSVLTVAREIAAGRKETPGNAHVEAALKWRAANMGKLVASF